MKFFRSFLSILLLFFSTFAMAANQPRVSIITSLYKGEDFIERFMENITSQSIFPEAELIIINANSPENEELVIRKYMERFPNIIYERLEEDPGIYAVWNLAIKRSSAPLITNANLDDQRNPEYLEFSVDYLENHPELDLVYANFLVTHASTQTFKEAYQSYSNANQLYCEVLDFSPEKMFMCLPGPQPLWRKSLHEKYGLFSEKFFSSGDSEMWNRAVSQGSTFQKLPGISGLYFLNPDGISTRPNSKQLAENPLIAAAYTPFWNGLVKTPPRLLIHIASKEHPEDLFHALDLYYKNLSGRVSYQFHLSLDEDDLTMQSPEVLEKLKTYPYLHYSFGPWESLPATYNRDQGILDHFDILLVASDDVVAVEPYFDKIVADSMTCRFPQFEGLISFSDETIALGLDYLEQTGMVFCPHYQLDCYQKEANLRGKILRQSSEMDQSLFLHWRTEKESHSPDRDLFLERQQSIFGISKEQIDCATPKLWSILICTLEERAAVFARIFGELEQQIQRLGLEDQVEVLYFLDNREHTIGYKRNWLLERSSGKYVCFVDDDDMVSEDYIEMIYEKLWTDPDCVSLTGVMTTDGEDPHVFIHSIDFTNYFYADGIYYRPPNHCNPIRRAIAIQFPFLDISYGEDKTWALTLANSGLLKSEEVIKEPYYFYYYDSSHQLLTK